MVKFFCDKCGGEIKKHTPQEEGDPLHEITIKQVSGRLNPRYSEYCSGLGTFQLCGECAANTHHFLKATP